MEARNVATNFLAALLAQGVSIVTGVLASLIVPKILGVEAYGYWQLFIFYASYVGFFHFGLCDGVYLKEGGKTRDTLPAQSINAQFLVCLLMQVVLGATLFAFALLGNFGENRAFVLAATALFLVINNLSTFVGYLLQATNEIKLYARTVAFNGVLYLAFLLVLLVARVPDFRFYIGAYVVASVFTLAYRLFAFRSVLSQGTLAPHAGLRDAADSIRVGIKLMIANISSLLILGVARFALDAQWGIEVFGYVSFALSMVSLFAVFISQASMVLFPALRQSTAESQRQFFILTRQTLNIALPLLYLPYAPLCLFVLWWLPQYEQSLPWVALLLPFCVFDGKMNILGTTYLKVLRGEKTLLLINVSALGVSLVGTALGVWVFTSAYVVVASAVAAIVFRAIMAERCVSQSLDAPRDITNISLVLISVIFLVATSLLPYAGSCIVMIVVFVGYIFLNRSSAREAMRAVRDLIKVKK